MTATEKLPAKAWLIVGLLFVVGLLNYLDRIMVTTMRDSLKEMIAMTDAQFGLLTSMFLWVYAALSPIGGFLADRFTRSRVIIGSLFAWSAITWLTAHATTFNELLVTRALMGISEACYLPAAVALITDYHRGTTRSLACGIHMSGIMIGSGLGGLGGWIAEKHGWPHAFNLFGLIGIAYSVVIAFLLRDAPMVKKTAEEQPGFFAALNYLFRRRDFLIAICFWGTLGMVGWSVMGWMPTYLKAKFSLGQGAAGLSATAYVQTAAFFGVLLGGAWADRWAKTNSRGRILLPAIGLLVAAPAVLLVANTDVLTVVVCGLFVYGFSRAAADTNMMPILCMVTDVRYRATGYGVLNFFACAIGGVGIYAGGALRDAQIELDKIFMFAAGGLVLCSLLLLMLKSRSTDVQP